MTKYKHLNLTKREFISIVMAEGNLLKGIPRKLNQSASTLSKKIQRNALSVYKGHKIQEQVKKRDLWQKKVTPLLFRIQEKYFSEKT